MLRPKTSTIAGVLSLVLLLSWFLLLPGSFHTVHQAVTQVGRPTPEATSRLHLLVVATSSDLDLCRLLLSANALSYPTPVFIDWAGEGEFNAAETHLAKVAGPLRYLENLSKLQDSDIVLLVDGFDVIFQLGPDVLLKRYFQEIDDANARLKARFGTTHMRKHDIYNSILFGPDKVCWPDNFRRAACWAVPDSTLPRDAFGPYTDKFIGDLFHARPRWLNSGTIMGPVSDMRELFRGTTQRIKKTFDINYVLHNSDQMYFADLWADQEYARTLSLGGKETITYPEDVEEGDIPVLSEDVATEYHIGLDYKSSLFQTAAGYRNYVAWMTLNQSSIPSTQVSVEPYNIGIQHDVLQSGRPFAAVKDDATLSNTSWRDVPLGVNTVTGAAFPLLHYTGDKSFRDAWWTRMWFYPEAERLQRASSRRRADAIIGDGPVHGAAFFGDQPYDSKEAGAQDQSGAWSDQGDWLSWDNLCQAHEDVLYGKKPRPVDERT